jgi:hypothetical protein
MENLTELVSVSFADLRPVPMWITGRIHANQWPDVMRIAGRMPENTQQAYLEHGVRGFLHGYGLQTKCLCAQTSADEG